MNDRRIAEQKLVGTLIGVGLIPGEVANVDQTIRAVELEIIPNDIACPQLREIYQAIVDNRTIDRSEIERSVSGRAVKALSDALENTELSRTYVEFVTHWAEVVASHGDGLMNNDPFEQGGWFV